MNQLVRDLNELLNQSDVKPWLDFNLLENSLWLYSEKEKSIYWYANNQVLELKFEDYKKWLPQERFLFATPLVDNKKILIVNLDHEEAEINEDLLQSILRGSFLAFYQENNSLWIKTTEYKKPIIYFPSLERPRYYRYEMLMQLERYLKTRDQAYLHSFSWWFLKWKTEFPEEFQPNRDRQNGAAQYYASILLQGINSQRLADPWKILSSYKKMNFKSDEFKYELFNLVKEAQFLGFISGITLDLLEKNKEKWKKDVNKGASSLELLARKFKPQSQKADVIALNEYIHINIKKMELLDPLNQLGMALTQLSDQSTLRLVIDNSKIDAKNYSYKGNFQSFFSFDQISNVSLTWLSSPLQIKGGKFHHQFNSGDVWIRATKTPCQFKNGATILILNPKDIIESKSELVIQKNAELISMKFKKRRINKVAWYCLIDE